MVGELGKPCRISLRQARQGGNGRSRLGMKVWPGLSRHDAGFEGLPRCGGHKGHEPAGFCPEAAFAIGVGDHTVVERGLLMKPRGLASDHRWHEVEADKLTVHVGE